jgi:Amt family ammonium transporter
MELQIADVAWLVVCAALVFVMQAGFLCLESGLTRSKNSINVALKNVADFGISVVLFWGIGFGLMFGASQYGLLGTTHFFVSFNGGEQSLAAFFLFQAMFCGTATTIVSGAVAERMRFSGYLVVVVLLSVFVYTLFGHWAWGGVFNGREGWLEQRGFVDFAGSTVVHSVGGWVALAAVLVIGPRRGRFSADGTPRRFGRQNIPMASLGVLLLWIGWFGFNGGSTFRMNDQVPSIIANTTLGGAAGMVTALALAWWKCGRPDANAVLNGALAGLVAVTANCNAIEAPAAILIGGIGGAVMLMTASLLERFQIDDVVGAIPVHVGAGVWGTIAVALFSDLNSLGTGLTRSAQFGSQLLGIAVCCCWAFGVSYAVLKLIDRWFPLRVSAEDEEKGLNVAEHGESTELFDLLTTMNIQTRTGDWNLRVPVEPFTEVGEIAVMYNQVLESLSRASEEKQKYAEKLERSNQDLTDFAFIASHDLHAPLRRVRSFCSLLQQRYRETLDDEAKEFMDIIVSEADSMQNLIDDLLNFSRVTSHGKPIESTDSAMVFDGTLRRLHATILESEAQITHGPLPTVLADTTQLGQLFQNLLSNAIKYCRKQPRVHVSATSQNGEIVFSVRDNGIGVPPEHADDIFFMLKRLHSADEYPGTGVGLAICKRIVERHGGRIWVDSLHEQGSEFFFTLPIVE